MSKVYLLCFDKKIGNMDNPRAQAKHYIGFAKRNLWQRIADHVLGEGAKITQFLHKEKIGFIVARYWDNGSRKLERKLKNRKNARELCPRCSGFDAYSRGKYDDISANN